MYTVGIDVSKGKSMIAVMRPGGEEVLRPFEVHHTGHDLTLLSDKLKSLDGETRVVMEATGSYHLPIAWLLDHEGFYVSVVNPVLIHGYGNNSVRRGKTDKKDALKIASYGLQYWADLPRYLPQDPSRQLLKTCYRQYQEYSKTSSMFKNNLISLMDQYFLASMVSSPALSGPMAARNGSISLLPFIIVTVCAAYLSVSLPPDISAGVPGIAISSVRIRRRRSMPSL